MPYHPEHPPKTTRGLEPTYRWLGHSWGGSASTAVSHRRPCHSKPFSPPSPASPKTTSHLCRARRPPPRIDLRRTRPRPSSSPRRRRSSSPKAPFSTPLPCETPVFQVASFARAAPCPPHSDPSRAPLGSNPDGNRRRRANAAGLGLPTSPGVPVPVLMRLDARAFSRPSWGGVWRRTWAPPLTHPVPSSAHPVPSRASAPPSAGPRLRPLRAPRLSSIYMYTYLYICQSLYV